MNDKTYQEYADRGRFVIFNNHETDARTVASQLLISKSIKQHNLKRVISFHSRKKTALEFIETFSNIQPLLPENEKPDLDFLNAIFGEMPQAKRHNILKLFDTLKEGKSGLLANVRCLAEGVDVPAIDGIAFIDPKGSEIDIVQAVGRAIRKAPDKTLGTVIIPLFVDVDEDGTISLEQSCFQTVWKVLQDLRAHDDILAESIDNLRLELGRRGFKSPPKLNKITIDLPAGIGVEFSNALRIKIVERCSSSWMFYFGLLENFIEKYSHSNIPITYLDNPSLAKWVGKQRVRYKEGKLAKERVEKLERVGFIWDPFVAVWEEMFVALSGFKIKEGHCNVPHSQNQQLGSWSSRQRNLHKKGLLSIERIGRLEKLGFQWDLDNARWEEMYVVLCNFNKANLHCNVPQNYKDNPMLASWVNTQRNNYKKGLLSTERVTGLNQIGVEWDPLDTTWEKMYVALCKFQEVNGHTNVPSTDKNKKLASWVVVQRVRYKKGRLSEERIKKLEQLNFIWDPLNTEREKMIATLRAFKEMHGHCNVPQRYLKNQKLGSWVATQRASHNKGKLPTELVSLLEELGLIWDPFEAAWEEKFLALCEFKQLNGHCRVPKEYNENPPLGAWVSKQRKLFNKGKLSIERSQRLEAMGVIWEPQSKKS
jgi:hypothetical protein